LFVITDENVHGYGYASALRDSFIKTGASWCELMVFPFGEATKSYDRLKEAHDWMLSNNVHRDSIVVAVGGGVIGDLAGFAASTIMRGVPFVQVPTSLLAQVDSSVGGKTGINTAFGKNLVGSFYQPASVVIDIDTLKTLPERELYAGYAEVVKYGLIGDKSFFRWLENGNGKKVLSLDPDAVAKAIDVCCKAKAKIVEADEREGGKRALLNLGHTFGHAFEALSGYDGTLLHGEAVALGTVLAFDLSVRMGLCPSEDYERVVRHFCDVGLPVDIYDTDAAGVIIANGQTLKDVMLRDKKVKSGKSVFILANCIGDALVHNDVPEGLIDEVLEDFLKGRKD
ncbi:MAG: 3-dehydroquinate synthase, partial [Alphaproteobacteria bacterium]|nr:3-dehydroquinate synthase [Alphaproteobacteria bacterium]